MAPAVRGVGAHRVGQRGVERRLGLGESPVAASGVEHFGAAVGQGLDDGAAHADGAAGDDGLLALQGLRGDGGRVLGAGVRCHGGYAKH